MRSVAILSLLLLGCTPRTPSPSSPTSSPSSECVECAEKKATSVRRFCSINEHNIGFQTDIETQYSDSTTRRYLWSLTCSHDTQECKGQMLRLDGIDRGEPIGIMDIWSVKNARLTGVRGNIATIDYPEFRTFVVDVAAGVVRYTESGTGSLTETPVEGRGIGQCE